MTDNLRESMSALMDDEANELEVRRILNEMHNNEDIRSTWARYQLVSGAMRRQAHGRYDLDISGKVAAAIAGEQVEMEVLPRATGSQGKPLVSFAVAASVAVAVVFGALQLNQPGPANQPGFVQQPSGNAANSFAQTPGTPPELGTFVSGSELIGDTDETPAQKRLRALINNHEQQADLVRGRGVMPYAQLVSDEKQD